MNIFKKISYSPELTLLACAAVLLTVIVVTLVLVATLAPVSI